MLERRSNSHIMKISSVIMEMVIYTLITTITLKDILKLLISLILKYTVHQGQLEQKDQLESRETKDQRVIQELLDIQEGKEPLDHVDL